ncbi:MAG TPA: APC family permease [Bacillales bacterium]|nr:APC family permease [Bacillales bacterium]
MNLFSTLKRFLIGKPLRTEELESEKMPIWKGLPILSSDAMSSVAYGTEQILLVLAIFGSTALWYSLPITGAIIFLLTILILSYRQVTYAYPEGGGAYNVSSDNLGLYGGLVAGSALLVDYTLTVAVSSSAGVAAITSAFPALHDYSVLIAVLFVLVIMMLNLRGIRESGTIFAFPTYMFILGIVTLIVIGVGKLFFTGIPEGAPPVTSHLPQGLTLFLLLRAFSSGCAALTGVEAISDSTPNFKKPESRNAARSLAILGLLMAVLFGGVSLLAYMYHITPSGTETVLSQIAEHTFGQTLPYYYIQATTALILILAANTGFSAFPILASIMAKDQFMPRMFAVRGDRLSYSNGIILLAIGAIILIVAFQAKTEHLIPLYAIGVFLSFTLAQVGLVRRWLKDKSPGWVYKITINGAGAALSFIVLMIFAVTKFAEGAWIIIVFLPLLILFFYRIHRHYASVSKALQLDVTEDQPLKSDHVMIIPVGGVSKVVSNTIAYAKTINGEAIAFYVGFDEESVDRMEETWEKWNPNVRLVATVSRYRSVIRPLLRFIDHIEDEHNDKRQITVLVPEFMPHRWWHKVLHNQTALMIRMILLFRKDVVVSTVPFRLDQ